MSIKSVHFYLTDRTVQHMDLKQRSFDKSIQFSLRIQESKQLLEMDLIALEAVQLKALRIELEHVEYAQGELLLNGYQSWSESEVLEHGEKLRPLSKTARLFKLNSMGDYGFYEPPTDGAWQHSHEFALFRGEGRSNLIGSLNTDRFYTIIERGPEGLSVYVDAEGIVLEKGGELNIMRLFRTAGATDGAVVRAYMAKLPGERRPGPNLTGWTSWYFYYNKITEEEMLEQIETLSEKGPALDVFQIDEGYQKAIGDWLHVNENFPGGMKHLADEAKRCGFLPGIWLAPFICDRHSFIWKEKKEWLLRDEKGHPIVAGGNPLWGGSFFALDFYNKEFQQYLRKVLRQIFRIWGYGLVKLDFLYAVNMRPRPGRTRAMVMRDAIALIMEEAGSNLVQACGVPLASAFKQVDYCRVGPDASPGWDDGRLRMMACRERISTRASLINTLNRAALNGAAFGSDPDVFMLRSNEIELDVEERHTLFLVNHLLGSLVFFSDDIRLYTKDEMDMLRTAYPALKPEGLVVTHKSGLYKLSFTLGHHAYVAYVNMSDRNKHVILPEGSFLSRRAGRMPGGSAISLEAHMTRCFMRLTEEEEAPGEWGFPMLI